jgi:hypothetical protein
MFSIITVMPLNECAIFTTWKFVVEFEDDETNEISATLGQADTAEECEGSIEDESQYQCCCGKTVLNIESWEVCAGSVVEEQIPVWNDDSGGHLGRIAPDQLSIENVTVSVEIPLPIAV